MNDLFLRNLHIEIYGGSHDEKIGVRLSGLPAGERFDRDILQRFLDRRAPSSRLPGTKRREDDVPVSRRASTATPLTESFWKLSFTTVTTVRVIIRLFPMFPALPTPTMRDNEIRLLCRPAGRTLLGAAHRSPCVAGGIALQLLERRGVYIGAHIETLGGIHDLRFDPNLCREDFEALRTRTFR